MSAAAATVLYGAGDVFVDVTDKAIQADGTLYIPAGDHARAAQFGTDPTPGTLKVVRLIQSADGHERVLTADEQFRFGEPKPIDDLIDATDPAISPEQKLRALHATMRLVHGSLGEEYPEQLMTMTHLAPIRHDVKGVLEIGANVGRNSCVIASLLQPRSERLVAVEPSLAFCRSLQANRDVNGLHFNIEAAAISRVPLMHRAWDTTAVPDDGVVPPDWTPVTTLSWADLKNKWGLAFDVLVCDCEGALYYILKEEPDFMTGFRMVLIENDFKDAEHKQFVDAEFARAGLSVVSQIAGGWGPCQDRFYECWAR